MGSEVGNTVDWGDLILCSWGETHAKNNSNLGSVWDDVYCDPKNMITGIGHQSSMASQRVTRKSSRLFWNSLITKNAHRIAQLMRKDFVMFIFILFISRMKVTVTTETWILFMKVGWKGAVVSYNVSQCVTMSIDCLGFLPGSSWHALPPSVKSYPLVN